VCDVVSFRAIPQDDVVPELLHFHFTTISNSPAVDTFASDSTGSQSLQPQGHITGVDVFTTTNNPAVASSPRISNDTVDLSNESTFTNPFFLPRTSRTVGSWTHSRKGYALFGFFV
jgi:hypothetical protein